MDIEGQWSFWIDFDNAVGDIDIGLWDTATNNFVRRDGAPVQSQGNGNSEAITSTGPGVVVVYGFSGASAPYTITLERR